MEGLRGFETATRLVDQRMRTLKESFEANEASDDDKQSFQYLLALRERLEVAAIKAVEIELEHFESTAP